MPPRHRKRRSGNLACTAIVLTSIEVAIRELIEDVALAFRAKDADQLVTFYERSDALESKP